MSAVSFLCVVCKNCDIVNKMIKQVSPSQQVILHLTRINYNGYMVNIPNLFNYQSTAGSVIFTACWIMQALFEVMVI